MTHSAGAEGKVGPSLRVSQVRLFGFTILTRRHFHPEKVSDSEFMHHRLIRIIPAAVEVCQGSIF